MKYGALGGGFGDGGFGDGGLGGGGTGDGGTGGLTGVIDPAACLARLPALVERLSLGARAFAYGPGHYDFSPCRTGTLVVRE